MTEQQYNERLARLERDRKRCAGDEIQLQFIAGWVDAMKTLRSELIRPTTTDEVTP